MKRDKSVAELVEKYTEKYPYHDRDLLRKLIRLENPTIFAPQNPSYLGQLRKLDRYLRKEFNGRAKKPVRKGRILNEETYNDALTIVKHTISELEKAQLGFSQFTAEDKISKSRNL